MDPIEYFDRCHEGLRICKGEELIMLSQDFDDNIYREEIPPEITGTEHERYAVRTLNSLIYNPFDEEPSED